MYKIVGTSIELTRGDSFYCRVGMKNKSDGTDYVAQQGDTVSFALKKKYKDDTPLVLKDIPVDTKILHLEPSDTKPLEVGDYVYDIELTTVDGDVDTFIDRAKFKITEEVY